MGGEGDGGEGREKREGGRGEIKGEEGKGGGGVEESEGKGSTLLRPILHQYTHSEMFQEQNLQITVCNIVWHDFCNRSIL